METGNTDGVAATLDRAAFQTLMDQLNMMLLDPKNEEFTMMVDLESKSFAFSVTRKRDDDEQTQVPGDD